MEDHQDKKFECIVCLEMFSENQVYHNTFCAVQHLMCKSCATEHLNTKYECPYCKAFMCKVSMFKGTRKSFINQEQLNCLKEVFKENLLDQNLSKKLDKRKYLLLTCLSELKEVLQLLKDLKLWKGVQIAKNVVGIGSGIASGIVICFGFTGVGLAISGLIFLATHLAVNHYEKKKKDQINAQITKLKSIQRKLEDERIDESKIQRFINVTLNLREVYCHEEGLLAKEDIKFYKNFIDHVQKVSLLDTVQTLLNSVTSLLVHFVVGSTVCQVGSSALNHFAQVKKAHIEAAKKVMCEKIFQEWLIKAGKLLDKIILDGTYTPYLDKAAELNDNALKAATFEAESATKLANAFKWMGGALAVFQIVVESWSLYKNYKEYSKLGVVIKEIESKISVLENDMKGI